MTKTKTEEKAMPTLYTTDDVCKIFHIGRVKCLELFHRADFPAQKYGRGFVIEIFYAKEKRDLEMVLLNL